MKYFFIFFLLAGVASNAQYVPNSGAYQYKGLKQTNSLQPPSASASPVTATNAPDSNYAALYYNKIDTTWYQFNPVSKIWSPFVGSLEIGTGDSIFITSIDSIFITNTDSIFIVSGNDTIYIGDADNIRDTAKLIPGPFINIINSISPEDSIYKPNGFDVVIAVDTIGLGTYVTYIVNNDTTIINNQDSLAAQFYVDTLANAPPVSPVEGYKVLIGTSPTGVFADHANQIAERVGSEWVYTIPESNDVVIVDDASNPRSYQFNGATWDLVSIFWKGNGNKGMGRNMWLGKGDKQPVFFRSWNKIFMQGDTTRHVYFPKWAGLEDSNVIFRPGANGKLDTVKWHPLGAGTNVTFSYSGDTTYINSEGGGGSGNTNSNIGSGYRLAVPNTNDIKTLHAGTNITMDSVSNADEITINSSSPTKVYAPLVTRNDSISQRTNVLYHGATGDGIYDTTISISSSSQTVTATNSIFASTDVGKVIVIVGAGTSSRDLVGTITAYTSATQVTISAAASTTVSNAPTLFGTDQTTHIQAAINACYAGGGGTVWIPNGIYLIAGALQTSVGGINMNAQLYIPAPSTALSLSFTHITIEGETAPTFTQYGALTATNFNTYKGATLVSTLTTGATGAAVIGTKGITGVWGSYNYNYLTAKNLSIKVLDNPAGAGPVVGGISYKYGASIFTDNVMINPIGAAQSSVLPTNLIAGIETPDAASETMTSMQNTLVAGFRSGYIIGEHTSMNQVQAFVCYRGFQFKHGAHDVSAIRMLAQWCTIDLYIAGQVVFQNLNFSDEYMFSGYSGGKWYDNTYTIKDTSNTGYGIINYTLWKPGVGKDDAHFTMDGGANLTIVSDTAAVVIAGRNNTFNTNSVKATTLKNSHSQGGAAWLATNNNDRYLSLGAYGSSLGVTNWDNKGVLAASHAMVINSDAAVTSGGSNSIRFVTGGSGTTYMADFNSSGNAIFSNKVSVGTNTSPTDIFTIQNGTSSAGGFQFSMKNTAANGDTRFLFTNSSGGGLGAQVTGSSYADANKNYLYTLGNNPSLVVMTNVDVSSGGAGNFDVIAGGNSNAVTLRVTPGNTGNVLIGTTTNDATNKLQVNGNVKATQYRLSALNAAPSSASDTGTTGEIRITSTYIYVCVATNTWVRAALATW